MNNRDAEFAGAIRQLLNVVQAQQTVRRNLMPDLEQARERVYAFDSREAMVESYMHAALDLEQDLINICRTATRMPKPFGDMFCYIAYCDLHDRMRMYQELADHLTRSPADGSTFAALIPQHAP